MCEAAPNIIYMFDRMGVPFSRTNEGLIDFRRFGGTLHHRTAHAGATTGQQLLYALDEQVRRAEVDGLVTKYEGWEAFYPALDDNGRCVGVIGMDIRSMNVSSFPADAVVYATGGLGAIFGFGTNSIVNTGSAIAGCYQMGAIYGNPEFIQIHPTAISGGDKLRLMSESVRGEGGRVWVPKNPKDTRGPHSIPEAERWYFLEEKYPAYGNLVPRDVASREIHHVVHDLGHRVEGEEAVYLDLTHLDSDFLTKKLGGVLEIYEKFRGTGPAQGSHESGPGRSLLDGRPLGRLQANDQHSGTLRRRRVRIPIPRGESPRGERASSRAYSAGSSPDRRATSGPRAMPRIRRLPPRSNRGRAFARADARGLLAHRRR